MANTIERAPGYYDREIDQSARETEPVGVPATIIGPALKGPAFVPTTLGSYTDYKSKFGPLDSKFMAGYGVEKFLASRQSAVFIRVLGMGANTTTTHFDTTRTQGTVVNAGMAISGSTVGGADLRHKGSVQFITAKHKVSASEAFGFPMFSDNGSYGMSGNYVNLVRAVIFTASDTRIMVMNTNEAFTGSMDDAANIDDTSTNVTYRKFKLAISSSAGSSFAADDGFAGVKIFTASLNPSDSDYVGKLLNTNPENFETAKHLLYADFAVDAEVATVASGSGNNGSIVVASGSINTSANSGNTSLSFREAFGKYDTRYTAPKTPWFISQPFGSTEYNLFHFESIDDGAYANDKFKISIAGLKASADPRNDFGTFTVVVRDFNDTDLNPVILEQWSNVSLNPNAENYIAKVIGDKKVSYIVDVEDENDRKLQISGKYPLKSKFVRVVMNSSITDGVVPAKALPFGFRGFELLKTNSTNDTPPTSAGVSRLGASSSADASGFASGSILPPVPFRFKVTRGEISASSTFTGFPGPNEVVDSRFYWGVKFERNNNIMNTNLSAEANKSIASFTKFLGINKLDVLVTGSYADTFNENKFTLARVALSNQSLSTVTASATQHMRDAAYIRNGAPDASNYYITDGAFGSRVTLATLLSKGTASDFNRFSDFAKFTTMMYGGWDGVNILDKNANRFWDRATSTEVSGCAASGYTSPGATSGTNYSGVGVSNNAINSFRLAVNIATDEIIANNNVLAIPGQREPLVMDYAISKNAQYGLSFLPIDVPVYDYQGTRIFDGETTRFADVTKTADNFDARAIDGNSAAAYFPNIIIDDVENKRRVAVPASVAALAAIGYNDKVSYPWWAPAGLNRGALSFVIMPQVRINTADRNRLYDARINAVVKFPQDGFVIFSQRTLQQQASLLEKINIKRMVLECKRLLTDIGNNILWEQQVPALRNVFVSDASKVLSTIQLQQGISRFEVICDDSNNTSVDVDNQRINANVRIWPVSAVEFISMDFIITKNGIEFVNS